MDLRPTGECKELADVRELKSARSRRRKTTAPPGRRKMHLGDPSQPHLCQYFNETKFEESRNKSAEAHKSKTRLIEMSSYDPEGELANFGFSSDSDSYYFR